MTSRRFSGMLLLAVLGVSAAQAQETGPNYELTTDIRQTMLWILEPAAERIWDSAGFVIDASGETDLAPTSEAAWDAVVHGAATLGESGNLLMLPGRSRGADWNAYSAQLIDTSREALDAARARDADALFDAGGRIYLVCRGCHEQYWRPAPYLP